MKRRSLFASLLASIPGLAFTAAPEPARQNKVYWVTQTYQGLLNNMYTISSPFGSYEQAVEYKNYWINLENRFGVLGTKCFYAIMEELV